MGKRVYKRQRDEKKKKDVTARKRNTETNERMANKQKKM